MNGKIEWNKCLSETLPPRRAPSSKVLISLQFITVTVSIQIVITTVQWNICGGVERPFSPKLKPSFTFRGLDFCFNLQLDYVTKTLWCLCNITGRLLSLKNWVRTRHDLWVNKPAMDYFMSINWIHGLMSGKMRDFTVKTCTMSSSWSTRRLGTMKRRSWLTTFMTS